jgi:hypothetical protein
LFDLSEPAVSGSLFWLVAYRAAWHAAQRERDRVLSDDKGS